MKQIGEPQRILLMMTGDVADVLRKTPCLKAVRKRYPRAHLAAIISERGAPALAHCPYLDEIIVRRVYQRSAPRLRGISDKLGHFAATWWRLRGRFDLVVSLFGPDSSGPLWNALAFFIGARWRVGYGVHHTGWLLTHNLDQSNDGLADEERMERLVTAAGVIEPADDPFMEMWPTADDGAAAASLLHEHGIDDDALVVAIGPGSDWSCQQWDLANWATVGDALAERYGARVVVVGTATEKRLANWLSRLMKHQPVDLTGRTTVGQLACVLRRCRLALTLESAPCAVAIAVGTPTVALFHSMPVWIRGQNRAPALGIRRCEGIVPTCYTLCKLTKMSRAVHRCESDPCIGGDGLVPITTADVMLAAQALLCDQPVNTGRLDGLPGDGYGWRREVTWDRPLTPTER